MKLFKIAWFAALCCAAIVILPNAARADDSCSAFLNDLAQWGSQAPQTHGYDLIGVSLMPPKSNNRFSSFFKNGLIETGSPDLGTALRYSPPVSSSGRLL